MRKKAHRPLKPVDEPGQKAMAYYRVSTTSQAEHQLSIPDQRKQARDLCKKKSWSIVAEFEDPGFSGRTGNRPELTRMMEAIFDQGADVDVVLVHSLSRFFRDAIESEIYVRKLAQRGIRLYSITQDFGQGPEADLIRRVAQIFDEYQSHEISKHVKRTMLQNVRNGYLNGSRPPFGYKAEPVEGTSQLTRTGKPKKKLAINEDEAAKVRLIYDLYLTGDTETGSGPMGVKASVNWLNAKGVTYRNGAKWSVDLVYKILHDPVYGGEYWYNWRIYRDSVNEGSEEIVKIPCPNIVPYETWKSARDKLEAHRPRKGGTGNGNAGTYILGKMIKCPKCGGALTPATGKSGRYRYYRCIENGKKGSTSCSGLWVNADQVEHTVLSAVQEDLLTSKRVAEILQGIAAQQAEREARQTERIAVLEQRRDVAQKEIDNLFAAVKAGLIQPTDLDLKKNLDAAKYARDEATAAIERETAAMRPESIVTPAKIEAFLGVMRKELDPSDPTRNPQAKHTYLRSIVDAIIVDGNAVTINGKSDTLRRVVASGNFAPMGWISKVPTRVLNWCPWPDSNQHDVSTT